MSGTITDFWRMIWEHKPTTIVMLTKQVEGGKVCPPLCVACHAACCETRDYDLASVLSA